MARNGLGASNRQKWSGKLREILNKAPNQKTEKRRGSKKLRIPFIQNARFTTTSGSRGQKWSGNVPNGQKWSGRL